MVTQQVCAYWWDFEQAQHHPRPPSQQNYVPGCPHPRWVAPLPGSMKVSCDTSFSSSDGRATLAMILRDSHGKLIDGVAFIACSSSAKQGEAHAIRLACMFLRALGLSNLQVKSDSQEVIALCVSELVPPWDISALLDDI
ncbi:hypothetical protein ACSBR2_038565 [Camellia fascicularis]